MTEDERVGWHHQLNGQELVMDREAWHGAVHGVTNSQTQLSDCTELNFLLFLHILFFAKINSAKPNNPIRKRSKDMKTYFIKENIQISIST